MENHKNELLIVAVVMLGVLLAVAIGVIVYTNRDEKDQSVQIVTTDVQGTINDIGELATAEYGYKISQTADKPSKEVAGFKVPFTASKVMYSYEGMVKAGIDFTEIEVMVNKAEMTIFVKLPDTKILSSEVDFDSLVVYDEQYSPFVAFTFSDMNLSQANLKSMAEEVALDSGLLDRANINAQSLIRVSLKGMYDFDAYEIRFY